MHEFVIIGGGVSGLACANKLADLGASSLVIEGKSYPKQAVCGEVISSQAIDLLHSWDIYPPKKLELVNFFQKNKQFAQIPFEAATFPRDQLEEALYKRALSLGVTIQTETTVQEINYSCPFVLTLSSGETIRAKRLLISAGRHFSSYPKKTINPYIGRKAHFHGVAMESTLEMHLLDHGYVGIAPVSDNIINIASLTNREQSLPMLIQDRIQQGELSSWGWLEVTIPQFGKKALPAWENAYFFGDTRSTIPPITGEGVTMAITSGVLAATCAYNDQQKLFEIEWKRTFQKPLQWGNLLHKIALNPFLCKAALHAISLSPTLAKKIHRKTEII